MNVGLVVIRFVLVSIKVTYMCDTLYYTKWYISVQALLNYIHQCRREKPDSIKTYGGTGMKINASGFAECWHDCNFCICHASEIGFSACRRWFQKWEGRSCQGGACHSSLPQCAVWQASQCVLHIQFPVFKSDTGVLFLFSLYQTEYDNVTWELLDEKTFMVFSFFFFFCYVGTDTACIMIKSSFFHLVGAVF